MCPGLWKHCWCPWDGRGLWQALWVCSLWKPWAVQFLQLKWEEKRWCGLWMVPSFQVWVLSDGEDEKRLPQSLLLAFRMVLGWLLSQLEEYLWVFGFSLYPQNPCCIFFFPPHPKSSRLCNISRNVSVYCDVWRKGQLFLTCEIIPLNSDFQLLMFRLEKGYSYTKEK